MNEERLWPETEQLPCFQVTHLSLSLAGEQLTDFLLFVNVVFLQELLVEPVGVSHSGHRILHLGVKETLIKTD